MAWVVRTGLHHHLTVETVLVHFLSEGHDGDPEVARSEVYKCLITDGHSFRREGSFLLNPGNNL